MDNVVLPIGQEVIVTNGAVTLSITSGYDGLLIANMSSNTAIHKKKNSRDEFLFTNAQPIQAWKEFDLLIGDSFK